MMQRVRHTVLPIIVMAGLMLGVPNRPLELIDMFSGLD